LFASDEIASCELVLDMAPINFLLDVILNGFFSFALFALLIGVCVADFYLCVNEGVLRRGYPYELETGLNVTC
jgi:hypothetical protein